MRLSALTTGILALTLPACATLHSYFESQADARFAMGLAAFDRGDYVVADRELGWIIGRQGDEEDKPPEMRALLALAAMRMDPRNPERRLANGANLIGRYLQQRAPNWLIPVAQTLYLLSLELGAAEDRVAQVEAEKQEAERRVGEANALPRLPDWSITVPARIRKLELDRDHLARRVEQLEVQLAERDRKLAEKNKELERIRRTLKT